MIQSSVETKQLFDGIFKLVEILVVPLLWKIYTTLSEISDKQALQAGEINNVKTILIGTDGKNGMRSRVRRLERRQEQTGLLLARHLEQIPPFAHEDEEDE